MQSLNDDMDRLFRRAAEGYPLDTGGADWDKVQSLLAQDTAVVKPVNNDRRKLLWLLLLLPLGFLCNQYVFDGVSYLKKPPALVEKRVTADKQQHKTVDAAIVTQKDVAIDKAKQDRFVPVGEKKASQHETSSTFQYYRSTKRFVRNELTPVYHINSNLLADKQGQVLQNNFENTGAEESFVPPHGDGRSTVFASLRSTAPFLYITWPMKPVLTHDAKQEKGESRAHTKRFYAGIMGGIDATTIKMQKVDALGYSAGILLGYNLSRKWSVESGAFLDKKFYYTKGEYFSKSHIYMPSYYTITTVTGDCRMWEIPVTLKYTLRQTATSSFFTTAGASSYFMKKESYDYDYKNINTGQEGSYYKSYTNSSKKFFSVVHLSAGYTHQLGRLGDLRIEPYVKIPVQKVGIGQMPITSGGIQVGITRKLF